MTAQETFMLYAGVFVFAAFAGLLKMLESRKAISRRIIITSMGIPGFSAVGLSLLWRSVRFVMWRMSEVTEPWDEPVLELFPIALAAAWAKQPISDWAAIGASMVKRLTVKLLRAWLDSEERKP